MNMNEKSVKDMTPQELASLAKPLGVPGLPFPTVQYVLGENGAVIEQLSVIESASNPLVVYSTLSQDRVMGDMFRDMPVPSMLPIVEEGLLRRRPEHKNKTMFMIGDAGFGKSFLAKLIARVRDTRGAMVVDCGNRNLNDLLFETTIDTGDDFREAVDAHLKEGAPSVARIQLLKDGLGEAFKKDGESYSIDWDVIGHPQEGNDSLALARKALTTLEDFCRLEGMPIGQSSALGLRTREGDLIRAFKEGREIILDEYNKSKEGTDAGLQTVLQFLNGEIDEAIVENTLKVHGREDTYRFTFRRDEMPIGFFVTMTGNDFSDGDATRALSRSAYSRLHPVHIGDPTPADWGHRISQLLTGLPLSTLYTIYKKQADVDPVSFGKELIAIRQLGLTAEQVAAIPPLQIKLLENWPKAVRAADMLAGFYQKWADVTDPDSVLLEKKEMVKIADEIDAYYHDEVSIDFRRIIKDISSALYERPATKDYHMAAALSVATAMSVKMPAPEMGLDCSAEFGSNLSRAILQTVGTTTTGRSNLRGYLLKLASDAGIVDPKFQEAQRSDAPNLSTLLDIDPYESLGGEATLRAVRGMVFEFMKEKHPDIGLETPDAISLKALATALGTIARLEPTLLAHEHAVMPVLGDGHFAGGQLVDLAGITDQAVADKGANEVDASKLIPADVFAASLIMDVPNVPGKDTLWSIANWQEIVADKINDGTLAKSESIMFADGSHESGLAVTTLLLRCPDKDEALAAHLFVKKEGDEEKALIIADGISTALKQRLADHGVTVINQSDPQDAPRVDHWLKDAIGGGQRLSIKHEENLKTAMALRNDVTEAHDKKSLVDILMDSDLRPIAPVVLQHRTAAASPQ